MELRGAVAVVTGASSGFGELTSRMLAKEGAAVVLAARRAERLETVASEIEGRGGRALAVRCDVTEVADLEGLRDRVHEAFGRCDVLINNAGIPGGGRFLKAEPERIEQVTRINYLGSVWCLRAFLDLLRAGAPADVVNVVSTAGTIAVPYSGPYSAAKHAQLAFSRGVTAELAPLGIRVHTVTPGPVHTPGFPQDRLRRRRWAHRFVLESEQVADAVVRAVERGTPELCLPRSLRLLGAVQALLPGTLSRLMARRGKP